MSGKNYEIKENFEQKDKNIKKKNRKQETLSFEYFMWCIRNAVFSSDHDNHKIDLAS